MVVASAFPTVGHLAGGVKLRSEVGGQRSVRESMQGRSSATTLPLVISTMRLMFLVSLLEIIVT
jgi:hypothetical protein